MGGSPKEIGISLISIPTGYMKRTLPVQPKICVRTLKINHPKTFQLVGVIRFSRCSRKETRYLAYHFMTGRSALFTERTFLKMKMKRSTFFRHSVNPWNFRKHGMTSKK